MKKGLIQEVRWFAPHWKRPIAHSSKDAWAQIRALLNDALSVHQLCEDIEALSGEQDAEEARRVLAAYIQKGYGPSRPWDCLMWQFSWLRGRWIGEHVDENGDITAECSCCHKLRTVDYFCSNCGAEMEQEKEVISL